LCASLCYNACINALQNECNRVGATLVQLTIALPLPSSDYITQAIEKALDENKSCKFAFFDHISSSTAIVFPVRDIVKACRKRGVKVMIDGAHAVGQIPLNLNDLDADYYTANFHKWLFAPKGSAFLWSRKDRQISLEPLVTSHEWQNGFSKSFWMQGTRDETAFIATGEALRFVELIGWSRMDVYRRNLLATAVNMLKSRWSKSIPSYATGGDTLICPRELNAYMASVRLPFQDTLEDEKPIQVVARSTPTSSAKSHALMMDLLDNYHIVLPVWTFQGSLWCRLSAQIYNSDREFVRLAEVIETLVRSNKY